MQTLVRSLGAVLFVFMFSQAVSGEELPFQGIEKTKTFPELPDTLFKKIRGIDEPPAVSVSFPLDYDATKSYPVVLFMGGSQGHSGLSAQPVRRIFGDRDFICISLPLFLEHLDPLAENGSNKWSRMYIAPSEAGFIWAQYKVLLAAAFEMIPNADPRRCFIGGFSNGANTTAALLSHPETRDGLLKYFRNFFLIEGGDEIDPVIAPADATYYMAWGDDRQDWRQEFINQFQKKAAELSALSQKVVTHEMPGTGHAFPPSEQKLLREYILKLAGEPVATRRP
ncbi:MAG: hypothetical protein HOO88_01590 [Kiritimatiellaceae bacterium]|nr:hypothetical protein [Kiritimatiellaceae bacterium]